MIKKYSLFLSLTALLAAGCSNSNPTSEPTPETSLKIYTSIAPLHFVCQKLLGDIDQVLPIIPVGEDEAEHVPEREVLVDMIQSNLIILNGAGFENWLDAVSIPETKIHDSAEIFRDQWIEYEGIVHSHGGREDHSHTGYNGHTWLSPYHFKKQSTSVYEQLKTMLSPEEQEQRDFDQRYNKLMESLLSLHVRTQEVFEPVKGTMLAATHPTYDYIGQAYGFEVLNIDLPPDLEEIDEAAQAELDTLRKQIDENGVSILFWEEEPSHFISQIVTEMGVRNLVFHPLAGMDDPDYLTGMIENLNRAAEVIGQNTP